jgi:FixJ family two-component response regulator
MASGRLISVVDDDQSVRESLPDLLRALGFRAHAFASAEEFLTSKLLDETHMLVLDVAMPRLSGPALQQELARRGRRIPVVFLTAQRDDDLRRELIAAGAADVLFKPATETELLEAVMAALRPP